MSATVTEPTLPAARAPRAVPTAAPGPERHRPVVRRLAPWEPVSGPVPPRAPEPEPDRPRAVPADERRAVRLEVSTMLRLVLEVLDGRRPSAQLAGRLSPAVRRYLGALEGRLHATPTGRPGGSRGRSGPPGLHSLRLCRPADAVCEVSAVWRYRGRHRALAARFEWAIDHWRCTALRLG